jgi:A/G-specific adenine glycosylase
MLQQTRVETVLERNFFGRWMERFPDVGALAAASVDDVLQAWEGLGYYRRARHLRDAACRIVEEHAGRFPDSPEAIRRLPGVGDYTTGAILAFAYDVAAPMVDGNVARVLARLFDDASPVDGAAMRTRLAAWSRDLADPDRARAFQSAIMELGQRICRPRTPSCQDCPVAAFCRTRTPDQLPRKSSPSPPESVEEHVAFHADPVHGLRLCREPEGRRRAGLWRLPPLPETDSPGPILLRFPYAITRFRVLLHVHASPLPPPGEWVPRDQLDRIAMAAPYRKALRLLDTAGDDLLAQRSLDR